MSQRRAAVAAAHEQRARSLEALGRRSDAIDALRSAVRIHEARLSDAMGLGIPRELLDADDIRPSGLVRGVIELVEQRVNPMFGWARPGAAAEAAAANMRLQLASARLALADVALREEEPRRDEAMEALATEQLARAVGSLQPLAAAAATALSKPPAGANEGSKGTASRTRGDDGDRSVTADIRRREVSDAPERHVAALVLFARAARRLAAAESARATTNGGTGDGAHHLGDAVEWLYASYGADARGAVLEAQARALLRELRECVACVAEWTR